MCQVRLVVWNFGYIISVPLSGEKGVPICGAESHHCLKKAISMYQKSK
jgi:hypothetical protein